MGRGDGIMMLDGGNTERFSSYWTNADNKKVDYITMMSKIVNNKWKQK